MMCDVFGGSVGMPKKEVWFVMRESGWGDMMTDLALLTVSPVAVWKRSSWRRTSGRCLWWWMRRVRLSAKEDSGMLLGQVMSRPGRWLRALRRGSIARTKRGPDSRSPCQTPLPTTKGAERRLFL
jgi:hypothetical protein